MKIQNVAQVVFEKGYSSLLITAACSKIAHANL